MGIPPMMRRMMEKMCAGAGELDLAALCREMMGTAQKTAATGGWAMPDCCKQPRASGRETPPAPEPRGPSAA
jgi:hypothetical protein